MEIGVPGVEWIVAIHDGGGLQAVTFPPCLSPSLASCFYTTSRPRLCEQTLFSCGTVIQEYRMQTNAYEMEWPSCWQLVPLCTKPPLLSLRNVCRHQCIVPIHCCRSHRYCCRFGSETDVELMFTTMLRTENVRLKERVFPVTRPIYRTKSNEPSGS